MLFGICLFSCNVYRLDINNSAFISDGHHLGRIDRLFFKNGHFYYLEKSGMLHTQGSVKRTSRKNRFILQYNSQQSNPFIYIGTGRDSIKEKQDLKEGRPVLDGYTTVDDSVLIFKKNHVYFNGYIFHKTE